ncbi:prepilin peptidase [Vibrio breoganii]
MPIILWGILSVIAVYDLKENRIPNKLLITIIVVKTFFLVSVNMDNFLDSLISGTALFGLGFIFFILRAMSPGDVKLLATIGFASGITQFGSLLFYLTMAGGLVATFCLFDAISKGYKPKSVKQKTNELALTKDLINVPHSRYEQKLVMPFAPSVVIGLALFYYFN